MEKVFKKSPTHSIKGFYIECERTMLKEEIKKIQLKNAIEKRKKGVAPPSDMEEQLLSSLQKFSDQAKISKN